MSPYFFRKKNIDFKEHHQEIRVLHFVNLGSVGGAERYFLGYISTRNDPLVCRQGVFLTGLDIHPFFQDSLDQAGVPVHDKKYSRGIKLPRFPRSLRRAHWRRVFREYAPGVALFWNQLREGETAELAIKAGLRPVYWERGSGWHADYEDPRTKRMLKAVDVAMANSRAGARILRYHGFRGDISICQNGLRPDLFEYPVETKRLPNNRPLVLAVVARLVPYKGVALALHVLRTVRDRGIDVRLRIAGNGPDHQQLRSLARALKVEKYVEFCDVVKDMAKFYENVDCLLHPALCEPSSNAVAEAIHFGVPVLAANVDGVPEVMGRECGRFIEPTLEASDYTRLGVNAEGQPEVVYFPDSDTIGPPRAPDPDKLSAALEDLIGNARGYERVSEQCSLWSQRRYDPYERYADLLSKLRAFASVSAD